MNKKRHWVVGACAMVMLLALSVPAARAADDGRPVAVFGRSPDVGAIVHSSLLPPDAAYDIPHRAQEDGPWMDPSEFHKYAAVVICRLSKHQPWSDTQIKQVESYVQQGGHLILLAGAPAALAGHGRNIKRLEPLVGGGYWTNVKEGGQILAPADPLMHSVDIAHTDWMKSGDALGKLTTARVIAGTKEAAVVSVNTVGKGAVVYIGHSDLFRVMGDHLEGVAMRQVLTNAILAAHPTQNPSRREAWIPKPLGPNVAPPAPQPAPIRRQLTPTRKTFDVKGMPVVLVKDGKAAATIVTADRPSPAARQAAQVIQRSIRQMSGAELKIVAESRLNARRQGDHLQAGNASAAYILVGDGQLAEAYGFNASQTPYGGFEIKTAGNVLMIAGRDQRENGLALYGTRNGAYAFLEHLGFRWLWPGDLGTVVPNASTVSVDPIHFTDAPAIRQRRLRSGTGGVRESYFAPETIDNNVPATAQAKVSSSRSEKALKKLGFSARTYLDNYKHSGRWFAEMKLGSSYELRYTHSYGGLWERFGKEHPEWFALQPDGTHTQYPERERLNVSNASLIEWIAKDRIAKLKADPQLDAVSISPNDGGAHNSFCMCEACRKLDPPQAPTVRMIYEIGKVRQYLEYPSLSDRMVTFYSRIANLVAEECPDRMVGAYAYSAYRSPPLYAKLAPNVVIGFVGLNYFNDPLRAQDLQRWDAWAKVAHQIFLRPNALLSENGMPAVFAHKLGNDIKHCYQTGMIATDFDSIMHHWAARGLNSYVLAQLLWDPSRDIDGIIDDYCQKGFGPAAGEIRAYFDAMEEVTNRVAASHDSTSNDAERAEERDWAPIRGSESARFYTPQVIAHLRNLLQKARDAAGQDEKILDRIDFLGIALKYAEFQHALADPATLANSEKGKKLLDERHAFFQDVFQNHPYALNVTSIVSQEGVWLTRHYDWKRSAK